MILLLNTVRKSGADPRQEALDRLKKFTNSWEPDLKRFIVGGRDKNNVSYKDIREALLSGKISKEMLLKWQQTYAMFVADALQPVWDEAFAIASEQVSSERQGFQFDPAAQAVRKWTENRAADFITGCSKETKAGIRAALKHSVYHEDISMDELAKVIRPMVGLTRPQVIANQNYYNRLLDSGMKPAKAGQQSIKYAEQQHRYRAQMIARTETAMAYNHAEYEVVRQAQTKGYIGQVKKVWCTADDERTCEICGALDGKSIGMNDNFEFKTKLPKSHGIARVPPAHPHCRCTTLYEETENSEKEED
jgi:SPP1 gp7 family putative phage head morphogenesis protein